ncbi:MAG: hypothetical protein ACHP65_10555, partial [Legionellales bacterium]
ISIMKLLVIVLCLLSERYLMHSVSYQRFSWFDSYWKKITKSMESYKAFASPWSLLTAIMVPVVFIVSVIYIVLHGVFFGLLGLLLSTLILLYCLGPQNAFYPISDNNSELQNPVMVGSYFAGVNSQLFAVLFWYVIAGPIAVLIYRLFFLCQNADPVKKAAVMVTDVLEWLPARLTVLLLLIVGNFQRGMPPFVRFFFSKPAVNKLMLSECGMQAVRISEAEEIPMPVAESLVEQASVVFLVFIALCTLVAWL